MTFFLSTDTNICYHTTSLCFSNQLQQLHHQLLQQNLATMSDPYGIPTPSDPFNGDPYNIDKTVEHDASQVAMLRLHPWMLLLACVILSFGGLWSGIIVPILRLCKVRRFTEGYSHASHYITLILSSFVGIAIPVATVVHWIIRKQSQPDLDFVDATWTLFHYWSNDERYVMPGYLSWYIYSSFFLNLPMSFVFMLIARWKPLPTIVQSVSERHGFIIAAHNSTRKLSEPIEAILKFAQPHQIFIADNGSSEEEQRTTREMCAKYTIGDSRIQVAHLRYGNKTLAQYACVYELLRKFDAFESTIDLITLIDDDVMIPATFPADSIEKQFEDKEKVAIAYPLRVPNAGQSVIAALQDCEYLVGNVARYVQDVLGTQLFASGAVATWKIRPLYHVLERHRTAFNGEDLEMGCTLHKLCDMRTNKLDLDHPVCIGLERNCVVPTTAPVCSYHWYDLLPASLKRKWGVKACKCGEHSFFNQRMRSWDPACHQFFFTFLRIIFSPRGTKYGPKVFIRILCLWKVISMIREYVFVVSIIWSFIRLTNIDALTALVVFYFDSIIISWAFGLLTIWTPSLSCSRQGLAMREDVAFMYPVFFELPYALIVRLLSVIYCFSYYLYWQRFPKEIRTQMEEDVEKAQCLKTVWRDVY